MNKKLKKMLAAVSAVAVCAVSMTSMASGALYTENSMGVTQYTTSFKIGDTKYIAWQGMNDYCDSPRHKHFISEDGTKDILLDGSTLCPLWGMNGYYFGNEEDLVDFQNYLTDNNIEYKMSEYSKSTVELVTDSQRSDEYVQKITKIKEDTGLTQSGIIAGDAVFFNVTDIVNELPEPTLLGDTDCNGSVNINDAILVMQSIANPDKYQLSWQGKANADVVGDGNGITISDAIAIQEIAATHEYD
ncbi:MAG: dockerin type I repeat-containing protein [Ruminococcus sp.]|nr:dockerin type I repeat-containing protein [Ruminococcus sp.]